MSLSKQHVFRSPKGVLVLLVLTIAVIAGAVAGGCSKPGLVGTWYSAAEDVTIEFRSDGKVVSDEFQGAIPDYKAENGKITVTVAGLEAASFSYTLDGDTLVLTDPDTGEPATFTRQKPGAKGTTATTQAGGTETTAPVVETSQGLSVDPALIGSWYSAEAGETLQFTADGLVQSSYDTQEGVLELVYSAEAGVLTISDGTDAFISQYSIEGDVLTIADPETGAPVVYERVAM